MAREECLQIFDRIAEQPVYDQKLMFQFLSWFNCSPFCALYMRYLSFQWHIVCSVSKLLLYS